MVGREDATAGNSRAVQRWPAAVAVASIDAYLDTCATSAVEATDPPSPARDTDRRSTLREPAASTSTTSMYSVRPGVTPVNWTCVVSFASVPVPPICADTAGSSAAREDRECRRAGQQHGDQQQNVWVWRRRRPCGWVVVAGSPGVMFDGLVLT
jgi:hypothetical protein